MKTTRKARKITTGSLISKLERCIALANMRGDKAAAERFTKALEAAVNSTPMREIVA